MRCEEAGRLISAGLDGELRENSGAELRAHLAACARCSTEQQALAGTVWLLRAVPAAEPPAALRRRIDGALQEIERRSQPRSLGLGWLLRSRTPGWGWGAAAGAAAGAVLLVLTRGHAPAPHLVQAPTPPPSRVAALPRTHPALPAVHPSSRPHEPAARKAAAKPAPAVPAPHLTVELPPQSAPEAIAPPELTPVAPAAHARVHPRKLHVRPVHRLATVARRYGPVATPTVLNTHPALPRVASAPSTNPTSDSANSMPRSRPLFPTDDLAAMPSGPDTPMDTSGMTQMASGSSTMPTDPAPEDDDLAELRRRLSDRPLQIPELGEPQPTTSSRRAARDGWIRF